jgi:competence protein ComEA
VGETGKWQMVAWAVAAALAVFAGARLLAGRNSGPAAAPVRIEGAARQQSATSMHGGGSKAGLYVHVAGAVRRPGLLRVADGARVAAAIERAGGATRSADLTAVNLAQPLEDGQQVIVPSVGAGGPAAGAGAGSAAGPPATGGPSGASAAPAGAAVPSLATATVEQLDQLDGIGPALAKRIVQYREAHGGFRSIGELGEVEGIGEKHLAALRKALRP